MRIYTVHVRPGSSLGNAGLELVKEGFSWPAMMFSFLWALACRLWLIALALLAIEVVLAVVGAGRWLPPAIEAALSVAFALLVGLFGNDLKRWTLARAGYVELGVVAGRNYEAAEQRLLDRMPELLPEVAR